MIEFMFFQSSLMLWGYILCTILSVALICVKLRNNKRANVLGKNAPQVQFWFPFGLDFLVLAIYNTMRHRDLEFFRGFFTPHGPDCQTVQANLLGMRCVFTMDPENIKAILATQFEDYGKGSRFHNDWAPFLGDSIFTTDGAQWRASRQLLRPQFLKQRVSDLSLFEKHIQILLERIISVGNGERVNINDLFLRYTLDTATEFLFGESVDSLHQPQDKFSKAFAEVQRVQNMITKSGPANIFVPKSSYYKSLKIIDGFIDPFIDKALEHLSNEGTAEQADRYTFLHALAEFTQDRKVLRDQIIAVLLAGRDTTASALSWTFCELARHPEVVRKLRNEIVRVVGLEKPPTYEDLKSMKYLQASIPNFCQNTLNETLRLYPPIPFNVRVALRDTSLPRGGGNSGLHPVGVLKDTIIGYSTLALQRRNKDSLTFEPERWSVKPPVPWTYLPFNGGPRSCVGQQFALAEMGYTIARMLQYFDTIEDFMLSEHDHMKGIMKTEIVLQPVRGAHIGLRHS